MISTRKAKNGAVSFYVRVGNGPSSTFNERDYRTRTEAKAAAKKHEADLILGKRPGRIPNIETYCERVLDHWANETLKNGGSARRPRWRSSSRTSKPSASTSAPASSVASPSTKHATGRSSTTGARSRP
jgi:hypothetical protein